MRNIRVIVDYSLNYYGLLKSIPLLKKLYNINDFTFVAHNYYISSNKINPIFNIDDFYINFHVINSDEVEPILDNLNSICQIITQEQENTGKVDITKYLIKYALRNKKFQLNILTDTQGFKLKETSIAHRSDRTIFDNFNLPSPLNYASILEEYLLKNKLTDLLFYLSYTTNLYFLKIAQNYEKTYGPFNNIGDIFDFHRLAKYKKLNHRYDLWNFLSIILDDIIPLSFDDEFSINDYLDKILRPFLDKSKKAKSRIAENIGVYLNSIGRKKHKLNRDRGVEKGE